MKPKKIICIICPKGCEISLEQKTIEGFLCQKGRQWAEIEFKNPTRIFTANIQCINGVMPIVSTKSSKPISLTKIKDVLKITKNIKIKAPVKIGDIITTMDLTGEYIEIIATRNVPKVFNLHHRCIYQQTSNNL